MPPGKIRRALHYAFYDWTREMPPSKRFVTWIGILLQGYAIYGGFVRSLAWPLKWPTGISLVLAIWLLYVIGAILMNWMLTSELERKTRLEADQIAARQIQQTLIPRGHLDVPGYDVDSFYKPFREVGGDYFDVIDLPYRRTLLTVVDVSGKGMAAALLAANIQALVRSVANREESPLAFALQINEHLSRYTPADRFATAVFAVLDRESGELTYVNAGHNAPIVYSPESTAFLLATGMPLGLFAAAEYEAGTAVVPPGGSLLLFTDGLTDSIAGNNPERRVQEALATPPGTTIANLKSLINPAFNEDDVTILLVKRRVDSGTRSQVAAEHPR
jgi:serine phosphatase RsbU (regulator of sigma subunit)